jgi:hypothetical protein
MENFDYHIDKTTERIRKIRHDLIIDFDKKGVKDAAKAVTEECFDWARSVQKKYPETYHIVRSYYGMISSHSPVEATIDDFKGIDSAFLFLENLRKRYLDKKRV